jgi:Na+/melibiose symporter-like transporter
MRDVWRLIVERPNLRLVASASLISLTGDWILMVGLLYGIYAATGSTVSSAVLLLAAVIPQVGLGSLAGVFVDRWDRKRTVVIGDVLMGIGLTPLFLLHGAHPLQVAGPVLFFESLVQQFLAPAEQALWPTLVDQNELIQANGLNGQNQNLARLVGSALGGVLAASGGIFLVAAVDVASFLVAAVLVAQVRTTAEGSAARTPGWSWERIRTLRSEWRQGLHRVRASRVLMALAIFFAVTSVGEGDIATLLAPFVRSVLHGGSRVFGTLAAVQAVGGMVGGLAATVVGPRISTVKLCAWGAMVFGTIDLAIVLYPLGYRAVWPAVVGMGVVGVPGTITMAGVMALYQTHTEDAQRGRVWGVLTAISGGGVLLGTAAAGLLAMRIGIIPVLAYQGLGYMGAGLLLHRIAGSVSGGSDARERQMASSAACPACRGPGEDASRGETEVARRAPKSSPRYPVAVREGDGGRAAARCLDGKAAPAALPSEEPEEG